MNKRHPLVSFELPQSAERWHFYEPLRMPRKRKRAQEEMVGFALIIILVAVILLVFLGISLRTPQQDSVESYEVESFIQSFLQYTSDCQNNFGYLSVKQLIFDCARKEKCLDERDICEVLNSSLTDILQESWAVGEDNPAKGYELKMAIDDAPILVLKAGNETLNKKGAVQDFSKRGDSLEVSFTAYY